MTSSSTGGTVRRSEVGVGGTSSWSVLGGGGCGCGGESISILKRNPVQLSDSGRAKEVMLCDVGLDLNAMYAVSVCVLGSGMKWRMNNRVVCW